MNSKPNQTMLQKKQLFFTREVNMVRMYRIIAEWNKKSIDLIPLSKTKIVN